MNLPQRSSFFPSWMPHSSATDTAHIPTSMTRKKLTTNLKCPNFKKKNCMFLSFWHFTADTAPSGMNWTKGKEICRCIKRGLGGSWPFMLQMRLLLKFPTLRPYHCFLTNIWEMYILVFWWLNYYILCGQCGKYRAYRPNKKVIPSLRRPCQFRPWWNWPQAFLKD